tara:strand:+ start:13760 stop:14914 length:1155 start_codon:yes stop_codon:yes gene_type:complete
MEFKVKEVGQGQEKSKAEIEEKLLNEHQDKIETQEDVDLKKVESVDISETKDPESVDSIKDNIGLKTEETPSSGVNDENVLSYIKERYNKEINSVDELFETRETNEDLPEDVLKYFEYKKETGRGIEDFYKLQKNYNDMDDDSVLADYYSIQEEGLDAIDIIDLMDDKFGFDVDEDEEKDIKKRKLAKKRELAKARKYFNEQKDKYKIPLESSGGGLSEDQETQLTAYQDYIKESDTIAEENKKRYSYFLDRTKQVFNEDFKGFEFNVGDSKINYKPGTKEELMNKQSDVNNFVGKFLDDKGLIEDAKGYHRALSVAMNPEKFAQFFYEQGVAAAVDDVTRKSKNINMDIRKSPQLSTKDGLKIRSVGDKSSGRGLKIRSINKS